MGTPGAFADPFPPPPDRVMSRACAAGVMGMAVAHVFLTMRRMFVTALLLGSLGALAQSRGSVRITGHVTQIASLKLHSASTFGPGVRGQDQGADGSLDYALELGDVGVVEGRSSEARGAEVTLALRSNSTYVLTATVVGSGFRSGSRDEIALSDIGFGIPGAQIRPSGDRARSQNTTFTDARFDNDPTQVAVSAAGEPAYPATLGDLQGETPILRGDAISNGGGLRSPNNALLVPTRYAVHPQYFKRNDGFQAVVVYTLTTP